MTQTRTLLEQHLDYSKYIFPISIRVLSLKIPLSKAGNNKKKHRGKPESCRVFLKVNKFLILINLFRFLSFHRMTGNP